MPNGASWFIAWPLSELPELSLPALPANFRRFPDADLHLTLAFLGRCGPVLAERAVAELHARLAEHPLSAFDVTLGSVVPMGPPHHYSALSALLDVGHDAAAAAMARLRDALTDVVGAPRDTRTPKPHVTLARPQRKATHSDRRAGLEWASQVDLGSAGTRLDRIALYTWSDNRSERLFRVVDEVPLR